MLYRDNVFLANSAQNYKCRALLRTERILENILNFKSIIGGITCDGDKSLLKPVTSEEFVQRFLFKDVWFIFREYEKNWLSVYPKSVTGFELCEIV